MSKKDIENANFEDTGYSYTLSLIAGKYKPVILYCLMEYEPVRFNEMQRYLKKVSDKTLSQNTLIFAWVGLYPLHASTEGGNPVELPKPDMRRDGSGTELAAPIAFAG